MSDLNPYSPPKAPLQDMLEAQPATCPSCGAKSASKVSFNWWGGALGPKLFSVVKCNQCKTQYNGKTGGKLTKVIIGYQVIAVVVFGALFFYLRTMF